MDHPRLSAVVVDDNADLRALLRQCLQETGRIEVTGEAADGRTAIRVVEATEPDLILLDLRMPVMDGLEALPRMREAAPRATVIAFSGVDDEQLRARAIAAGAAAFLPKGAGVPDLIDDVLQLSAADGTRTEQEAALQLDNDTTSGRAARRFVREELGRWNAGQLLDEAELLTTELVNNAVVHTDSDVHLHMQLRRGRLRVAITDSGGGLPERRSGHVEATNGRGLLLVAAMATDWGATAGPGGKTVWFELVPDSALEHAS